MKDDNANPYPAHHDIMLLLPWYVNKTLDDAELRAVENHLKVCSTCKREIAELNKLSLAIKQAATIDDPQASFSRLRARMHRGGDRKEQMTTSMRSRQGKRKFNFVLPIFPYRAIAALALCILSIPAYFIVARQFENSYRTLAASEIPVAHDNEIRVVFSESADSRQRKSVIDSIAGEIVEGPNTLGVYLIRLKPALATRQVLETLATLRKNSQVIFAEPAFSLSAALMPQEKPQ
ncbi:zf-HC2 domain-containing protein [Methylomicrobium sp. Wu6]|uniref:anti-sigma factor n=1 Tax=Methylomicrobium sp. Wu6 TaxID=3107928 RepID=UPI002DD6A79D|nr:zf-HC2 domain-containing protein [Methylomicrobium sp. Wu6]MEC4750485.1 zf-HC2 domain-containing protein [Methylomicrobium sp. Wu6]